jgi:hypothetical protein
MEGEITLRIVLQQPPPGVDFGVQKGHGNEFETVQTQRSKTGDLTFEFPIRVKEGNDSAPNFLGPFAQGPAQGRFVYLDIGTYAGQTDTPWSRRLKIPLRDMTWRQIGQVLNSPKVLEAKVMGTGKDGGPTCGSVKGFAGWRVT